MPVRETEAWTEVHAFPGERIVMISWRARSLGYLTIAVAVLSAADAPRKPKPRPDLSGTYDVATLTPLQRPEKFGDKLALTDEEAAAIARKEAERMASRNAASDPNREAPPEGGDGSEGAAGNVGGYNSFWIERGIGAFKIDGQWRTSLITDPKNGRRPPMTPEAKKRADERAKMSRPNMGEAWWVKEGLQTGPYDDPEIRPLAERCLLGFSSTGGPPMLPALYNNMKQIVQTEDHVMILIEMVHDARIIRLNAEHDPPEVRKWLGDSVGRWEGDTLVVDTTKLQRSAGAFEGFTKSPCRRAFHAHRRRHFALSVHRR